MTKSMSPEEIADMSEDCQCSCKELEQYKAWWERDSTALGKSLNEVSSLRAGKEQFRAAIERLQMRLKRHEPVSLYNGHDIEWWKAEAERMRDALKRVRRVAAEGTTHTGMIAALGILVDRALNPGNGPLPPDYTYHSHEPCEQRSEVNSIDDVAAICHSVTGLCCHILGSPGGPCTIGNCAAVRGYLGGPEFAQGASRDASSVTPPETERLTRISLAARALLKYLDDHDWGLIPEGQTANTLRDLLDGGCHGS